MSSPCRRASSTSGARRRPRTSPPTRPCSPWRAWCTSRCSGPQGLRETGETCMALAAYAKERLEERGVKLLFPEQTTFKEFAVDAGRSARRGDRGGAGARRQPRLRARSRLPRARAGAARRRDREAHGRGDRPAGRRARGVSDGTRKRSDEADLREVAARPARPRRAEARPAGARDPGRARAQGAAAAPRARRARGAAPLHRALDPQLRRRHRLLSARLLHDEVQPARQRAARRPAGLPRPAPARRRRLRPGRARARSGTCRRSCARSPASTRSACSPPPARRAS